eukprot:Blabericola_migrator_1__3965@NODE_21_length_22536_cov_99_458098_g18_i0_p9_GENE_NODE_21_length_22536_cov_99_458098_g18_i0NODE_21_length_22536_cov_99_458098_g18_i0_p9_ORF_typecomplete_len342_score69_42Glutaredoxin/PF00462_24/1_4e04Glutaredoxin/PF00462_24/4e19SH3BGR/PF04908_15/8_7e05_NODE_21_length_22536_cov_99_458098_g18_i070298054
MSEELRSVYQIRDYVSRPFKPESAGRLLMFVGTNHPPSDQMLSVLGVLIKRYSNLEAAYCDTSRLLGSRKGLKVEGIPLTWVLSEPNRLGDVLVGAAPVKLKERLESLSNKNFVPLENDMMEKMVTAGIRGAEARAEQILKDNLIIVVGNAGCVGQKVETLKARCDINGSPHVLPVLLGGDDRPYDEELAEALKLKYPTLQSLSDALVILDGVIVGDVSHVDPALIHAANTTMEARLNERLRALINKDKIMLFMKGTKAQPFCKFSREIVNILKQAEIDFDYFNIFDDSAVREGLKRYSNWPTFPQLYVNGELIGGVDVIKQMIEESNDGVAGLKSVLLGV